MEPASKESGRVLVTGCAGFIGSHLTETLLERGIHVVGIDCFNANYGRSQKLSNLRSAQQWDEFEFVPIDLARGDLNEYVDGVDTVFHLAAEPGVRASWGPTFGRYVANNLVATHHLLDAIVATGGVARLVYASSSSIYGQAETLPTSEDAIPAPISPYGITKLSGEHLCTAYHENHGLDTVALRYFTVFGPRQRPDMAFNIFCRAAAAGEPIAVYGDGEQTRDFTFVGDVVEATIAASRLDVGAGSVYNIGGGLRTSLRAVIATIEQVSGRALETRFESRQLGDVNDTGADTTRARAELGYDPQTALADGIAAEYEWIARG